MIQENKNSVYIIPLTLIILIEFFSLYYAQFHYDGFHIGLLLNAANDLNEGKLIYKDLPILGDASQLAVAAFFAALEQGQQKYDAFQGKFLKTDGAQSMDDLVTLAKDAGLDGDAFKKSIDSKGVKDRIKTTQDLAESVGITATPSIVLGDILIPGGVPMDVLKKLLDAKKPDLSAL